MSLTKEQNEILLQVAKQAIWHGLEMGKPLLVEPRKYALELQEQKASFVTLEINNHLRGCIGTIVAFQPLVSDVAYHAYAAAFADPRFSKLQHKEFPQLAIHISILSKPEPIHFISESHLLQQLRPGMDGVIIAAGKQRATFLPSVWESLTDPHDFLMQLKRKAGFDPHYWSDTIKVERYTVESISEKQSQEPHDPRTA
ncbi:MAG: AmmeMemoRadiSam system protein A [Thioploca sp.]|nr:AmmeMemoRadiSam system protein A [Thioploca sp.]